MKKHLVFSILVLGLVFPLLVAADGAGTPSFIIDCEAQLRPPAPYTLSILSEAARAQIKIARQTFPERDFFDIDKEAQIRRTGIPGPKALHEFTGKHWTYLPAPGVDSSTDITVGSPEIRKTFPVFIDMPWQGQPSGTMAYLTLPYTIRADESEYLIGPQYEELIIYQPGGGTKHARGENSSDWGVNLGKRGIAMMGLDLVGHGLGPAGTMASSRQIADWILSILDKTAHKNIKVHLLGHSWGAMLAVFMRNHSKDPKYARLKSVIAVSPGVDASLGGDLKKKMDFDQWYEENYHKLKHLIAEKDFTFLENSDEDDKLSIDGTYITTSSQTDYTTPEMTLEEQDGLIDMLVMTGTADGLVYVGHEEIYQKAFGNLKKGSELVLIGPATTYASKSPQDLIPSGHQLAYVEIPGTKKILVYTKSAEFILGERESAAPEQMPEEKEKIKVEKVFDNLVRQYAHYFPFREMLKTYIAYVETPTAQMEVISERREKLLYYIEKVQSLKVTLENGRQDAIKKIVKRKSEEMGIKGPLNLRLAQEELDYPPFTEERKKALEDFLAQVTQVKTDMETTWKDEELEKANKKLWQENEAVWNANAATLAKLGSDKIENFSKAYDILRHKKQQTMTNQEKDLRKFLGNLDREYRKNATDSAGRFGDERMRRLDLLAEKHGINPRSVERELNPALDRSPQRREQLKTFIDHYDRFVQEAEAEYNAHIQAEIEKIAKPAGIHSPQEASEQSVMLQAQLNLNYLPPDQPEIADVLTQARETQASIERINETPVLAVPPEKSALIREIQSKQKDPSKPVTLEMVQGKLNEQQRDLQKIAKVWATLWKEQNITNKAVSDLRLTYAQELEHLRKMKREFSVAVSEYAQERFKAHGDNFTRDDMRFRPESLRQKERSYTAARVQFLQTKAQLKELFKQEALAGRLSGERAEEAHRSAFELSLAVGSKSAKIKELAQVIENLRQEISLLSQRNKFLHWQYTRLMKEKGLPLAYTITPLSVYDLLDQDRKELMAYLEKHPTVVDALDKFLIEWEGLAKRLRDEQKFTDLGENEGIQ